MTTSISISWHMNADNKTIANNVVPGSLRLYEGEHIHGYPTLDIYMEDPLRADIAAAAINGDWDAIRALLPEPVKTEAAA